MIKFIIRLTFKRRELRLIEKSIERYYIDVENGKVYLDQSQMADELRTVKKIKEKFRIVFGKNSMFF